MEDSRPGDAGGSSGTAAFAASPASYVVAGSSASTLPQSDPFLSGLESKYHDYDENLYYAATEYLLLHELNQKQHQRSWAKDLIQNIQLNVTLSWKTWLLLRYENPFASRLGTFYFAIQALLAVASVFSLALESQPQYNGDVFPAYAKFWTWTDLPVAICFSADLIVYFVILPWSPNEFSAGMSKRSYFFSFRVWIDVISTLPTYLTFLENVWSVLGEFGFFKVFRVLRLLRALRVLHSVDVLLHTLERALKPLAAPFLLIVGIVVVFSTAIYYAERGTYHAASGLFLSDDCECLSSSQSALSTSGEPCPLVPSKFISIPHTMWFVMVTLSTVGYGDVVPLCSTGRLLASLCMFLGNVVIAMPIAIVGMYYTSVVLADQAGKRSDASSAFGRKAPGSSATVDPGSTLQPYAGGGPSAAAAGAGADAKSRIDELVRRKERRAARERRAERQRMLLEGKSQSSESSASDAGKSGNAHHRRKRHDGTAHDAEKAADAQRRSPLRTMPSIGLQLLDFVASCLTEHSSNVLLHGVLSLLHPEHSVVIAIDAKLWELFRHFLLDELSSVSSIAAMAARLESLHAPLYLHRLASPLRSSAPAAVLLTRPVSVVLASGDAVVEGLRARRGVSVGTNFSGRKSFYVNDGEDDEFGNDRAPRVELIGAPLASGGGAVAAVDRFSRRGGSSSSSFAPVLAVDRLSALCAPSRVVPDVGVCPDAWGVLTLQPHTGDVTVAPCGACRLDVNRQRLDVGMYRALLVGDTVSLFRLRAIAVTNRAGEHHGTSGAAVSLCEESVAYELVRVDGGSGPAPASLAGPSEMLRVLPTAPREDVEGFITLHPVNEEQRLPLHSGSGARGRGDVADGDAGHSASEEHNGGVVRSTHEVAASVLRFDDYVPTRRSQRYVSPSEFADL